MAAWGLGSSALLIFGAEPVFRIFIHEPEVVADGIIYLQVLGLSQMFMCEEILTEGALAGLGKTMQASVISVIFTAARIPMALILSSTALGLSGIWWAITLTSVVKGFVFVGYFVTVMRKLCLLYTSMSTETKIWRTYFLWSLPALRSRFARSRSLGPRI